MAVLEATLLSDMGGPDRELAVGDGTGADVKI
jgi:hypothetical protein